MVHGHIPVRRYPLDSIAVSAFVLLNAVDQKISRRRADWLVMITNLAQLGRNAQGGDILWHSAIWNWALHEAAHAWQQLSVLTPWAFIEHLPAHFAGIIEVSVSSIRIVSSIVMQVSEVEGSVRVSEMIVLV